MAEPAANSSEFADFYRATVAPLRRYLARFLGSDSDAQDVAHDAYLRVYPTMRERQLEAPHAFLYTTARRLALNRIRHLAVAAKHAAHHAPAVSGVAAAAPGVAQTVMARQEFAQLQRALAQLPPGCRAVLLLRKVEMLPHDEIARRLGISRSTVEKQHLRAIRLLRRALETAEDDAGAAAPDARVYLSAVEEGGRR